MRLQNTYYFFRRRSPSLAVTTLSSAYTCKFFSSTKICQGLLKICRFQRVSLKIVKQTSSYLRGALGNFLIGRNNNIHIYLFYTYTYIIYNIHIQTTVQCHTKPNGLTIIQCRERLKCRPQPWYVEKNRLIVAINVILLAAMLQMITLMLMLMMIVTGQMDRCLDGCRKVQVFTECVCKLTVVLPIVGCSQPMCPTTQRFPTKKKQQSIHSFICVYRFKSLQDTLEQNRSYVSFQFFFLL